MVDGNLFSFGLVSLVVSVKFVLKCFSWFMPMVQGVLYKLGDFQLKIGKVAHTTSESLRGIMVEVTDLAKA